MKWRAEKIPGQAIADARFQCGQSGVHDRVYLRILGDAAAITIKAVD
jgi:hypothetical protein